MFQIIHKRNRGNDVAFCLSEIEIPTLYNLPPSTPRSVVGDLRRALEAVRWTENLTNHSWQKTFIELTKWIILQFWASFLTLWTENRRKLTIPLCLIWILTTMGYCAKLVWLMILICVEPADWEAANFNHCELVFSSHGALSSWVVSHQASLRDWTFDKDAKMYEKLSLNHSVINEDLVNIRYHDSSFEDFSFANMVSSHSSTRCLHVYRRKQV